MPPAVGYADTSSAIENATSRIRPQMIGQPHDRDRPAVVPRLSVGREAAREKEMIVKEIAKFKNELHDRCSACE